MEPNVDNDKKCKLTSITAKVTFTLGCNLVWYKIYGFVSVEKKKPSPTSPATKDSEG